ncbi:MAG: DUF86 domain-containing protein [Anaerolineales bacterium]
MRFVEDLEWDVFENSELHQNAVIRSLEVIGEAARLVSEEIRTKYSDIPWKQIVGMRHRLIHEYFRVNLKTVWEATQNDLPGLVEKLKTIIPPDED